MTEQNEPSTPPNSHRAPDSLTTENELICEKLLGWRRLCHNDVTWWEPPSTGKFQPTMLAALSFEDWDEAGPLLEALRAKCAIDIHSKTGGGWLLIPARRNPERLGYLRIGEYMGDELTALIRTAALAYIRSLP